MTREPLYSRLLDLPDDAKSLEKKLEVDIAANFRDPQPERILRGAFSKSGVSGQNRLVERSAAKFGAYWKSYDFKPKNGKGRLVVVPLGPLNLFEKDAHPFSRLAFQHDGGEIIFNLPNGLQGYLLVNGEDKVIPDAPNDVVSDPLKTSGTNTIVNGLSCMACHKHGMIPYEDTLRDGSAIFGNALTHLERLHAAKPVTDKLIDEDRTRFLKALEGTTGVFFRAGGNPEAPITDFAEPIGTSARSYLLAYLDLADVARELDVADSDTLIREVGTARLKELGLQGLLKPHGVISRAEWESESGGNTLMQKLARFLNYTPHVTL